MPKGSAVECSRRQAAYSGDDRGSVHRLDEDAFSQGIDQPENLSVFTLSEQIRRLVVLQHGVWREQPVMRRCRLEHRREVRVVLCWGVW